MYRIWDKILKYYSNDIIVCQNGDLLELRKTRTFDGIFTREYTELKDVNKDSYIVQQCTGLTDKNGVLIYEGDRVKGGTLWCTNNYRITNDTTTVTFKSGMFKGGNISLCSFNDQCEIIGNIMEDNK